MVFIVLCNRIIVCNGIILNNGTTSPLVLFIFTSFKVLRMPRNITAAQKRAHVFYKSDVLAQTNQIKYNNNFFRMVHKTQKKEFLKI